MLILVTGPSGSGKSRFAEALASHFAGRKFYAATMIPYGAQGQARKEKHLRQRDGLGFITVECPFSLDSVPAAPNDLVLLEDVSNLLANLTFAPEGANRPHALAQIEALSGRCAVLIAVTIGRLTGEGCDEATRRYVDRLNALNGLLTDRAACAVELCGGEPRLIKGTYPWNV